MASNPPPFQVEDNTDEDFFDKLVNDDDDDVGFNITAATSSSSYAALPDDGDDDSDEVKAFSNLSIDELDNNNNNNGEVTYDAASSSNHDVQPINKVEQSRDPPLVSSDSFEFGHLVPMPDNKNGDVDDAFSDSMVVRKDNNKEEDSSVASAVSKTSLGSGAPGVKEVGWSAFHADSAENGGNGFGSYSDFFSELGGDNGGDAFDSAVGGNLGNGSLVTDGSDVHASTQVENSNDYAQFDEGYNNNYGIPADQSADVQDLNSSQYWENQYPGWKFDSQTGQWYQVDGYDAGVSSVANLNSDVSSTWGVAEGQAEVSYLQQSAHSVAATVADTATTESVTNWNHGGDATETTRNWNQVSGMSGNTTGVDSGWNQASQDNNEYPPHMVFDPQYPGWYYDTTAQEWRTLESYAVSAQPTAQVQDQISQKGYASSDAFSHGNEQMTYSTQDQGNNYVSQGSGSQGQQQNWAGSVSNYNQPSSTMWQPDNSASNTSLYSGRQLTGSHYTQNHSVGTQGSPQSSLHYGATGTHYENITPAQNDFSIPAHSQGYGVGGNLRQQLNDARINQNDQRHVSNEHFRDQNAVSFAHQQIPSAQVSYSSAPGRSSAGRPAHALVAFGFGGKLIVMKDSISSENLSFGSQNPVGGSISVLNLAEVVNDNIDASGHYFQALCKRSVPGPLAGGSIGTKELNKWIDERIANPESAEMDFRKAEVLRLLLSLLKIACQYYGKLRSPYGTDAVMKESDAPESAVAKLFASVKSNSSQYSQYAAAAQCLQQLPSEGQMRVTATEVQSLLVSGRKKDALQRAQEGQLWGPALVLAAQLGDQFYVETVKQMALRQLVAGSPLRTLCLLIAGQPADVFSADTPGINSMPGAISMPQQPAQFGANGMLDDWEENLAVITANRTKDDELVLVHLGDCLWKDKSDIIAAHICYLVAETSFEPYSDSARVCLVGADHWKFPRTYASPEAIQRTEIYEYSKTLGNSQFVLLPFQPYKLVYAHMLAEVGRISDALKYCQAVLKSLKTGRTPEVETLRQLASSLEERIKTHQQGGFSANLSSNKLVGKLLNLFDTTAHKVVGGLPPPAPTAGVSLQGNEHLHQSIGPRVSASQSTMAMSSLVPSLSVEPISELAANNNRVSMHTRSVSEPDFGRSQESSSTGKATGVTSRFGRFGFGSQLLQKTVGLVLKPRQGRQAKLGETNKFYYDEKLKRWVEEGSDPPVEEAALPPPPTTAVFQNGTSDYNLRSALQSEASLSNGSPEFKSPSAPENSSGMPPLPPISNQYSARGRMGVRSRYVDTFNKGGGNATNLFQSPSFSSAKPATGAKPQFFVPTPVTTVDQPIDASQNGIHDSSSTYENPSPSSNDSLQSSIPPSSASMQRFASMNNISKKGSGENNSFSAHSRRTASWSGSFNNTLGSPQGGEVRPLGEVLGMPPSSFMPNDPSSLGHSSLSGGSVGDDLQEVEL